MNAFSLSKADKYKNSSAKANEDIIDIKFPSELKDELKTELLIFVVEDDPRFMQILNTHLAKLVLTSKSGIEYRFKVRNFATGRSTLNQLKLNPDLIFLNYDINKGLPNALSGKQTLDELLEINPNQKVIILNELDEHLRGAFIENGLRDYLIKDPQAVDTLNNSILNALSEEGQTL